MDFVGFKGKWGIIVKTRKRKGKAIGFLVDVIEFKSTRKTSGTYNIVGQEEIKTTDITHMESDPKYLRQN